MKKFQMIKKRQQRSQFIILTQNILNRLKAPLLTCKLIKALKKVTTTLCSLVEEPSMKCFLYASSWLLDNFDLSNVNQTPSSLSFTNLFQIKRNSYHFMKTIFLNSKNLNLSTVLVSMISKQWPKQRNQRKTPNGLKSATSLQPKQVKRTNIKT